MDNKNSRPAVPPPRYPSCEISACAVFNLRTHKPPLKQSLLTIPPIYSKVFCSTIWKLENSFNEKINYRSCRSSRNVQFSHEDCLHLSSHEKVLNFLIYFEIRMNKGRKLSELVLPIMLRIFVPRTDTKNLLSMAWLLLRATWSWRVFV